MDILKNLLVLCAPLLAAVILGNLFLTEVKKARSTRAPWYAPYLTLPGLMVLAALCSPILIWLIKK
ncbi:MAG: hypothetical protein NWS07_00960, partial [Desulfobacterales bacterium]|nr:hypothetical protein [Desulfobacterales bacterium]